MGWVFKATPRPLYPREKPGTHFIGGWVGTRAGLDGCEKSSFPLRFDRRTVQPVVSRYVDWAIAAHEYTYYKVVLSRCLQDIQGSFLYKTATDNKQKDRQCTAT
jgi:hypothetical protein